MEVDRHFAVVASCKVGNHHIGGGDQGEAQWSQEARMVPLCGWLRIAG